MLPLTEGEDGRHGLAGSKTTVALGAKDGEMLGRLARMRTAQAQTVDADRAFVVDLACQRPADLGYAAEPRANDLPWAHAGKVAEAAGHPRLATVATGTVHNILADAQTEPHKMAHCRERRDPNLEEAKTRDVLLLHEQPSFRLDEDGNPVP